ncbi:MAG: NusG domain II-containing protein [Eubacterium sp.]
MKKADFILVGIIVAVAGVLLFVLYGLNTGSGEYVQIEVDGQVVESLPLDEDCEYDIKSDGGAVNTLVIKDGAAKMTQADCPDKICVNHRAISLSGESIICLPHKVVVSVVDEKSPDSEIDAVA